MGRDRTPRVSKNPYKGAGKLPALAVDPSVIRVPKVVEPHAADENDRKIRFRFDAIDHDGDWSLLDISRDDHAALLTFMANIETMTAGELFRPGHRLCKVYSDMSECPNEAVQRRLAERFQGLDHMARLEIDGLKRLYGVRTGHEFHIIWWDPKHEVWPSTKKRT
ncbi:hypothetical protein [Agromyces bauzanensis]